MKLLFSINCSWWKNIPVILALSILLGGCGQNTAKIDLAELRDPLIRKAKARVDQGDREGALECLNQALEKHPDLAQAHLDAALLYDDYMKDYVRAIYHYRRYVELRPDTEKKDMIEEMIRKARIALAASISEQLPGFSEKLNVLQEENTRLKNELREARDNASGQPKGFSLPAVAASTGAVLSASAKQGVALDAKGSTAGSAPVASAGRVYVVQEHETLSMIAAKMYQKPGRWKVIYDANRQTLATPDKLRVGQTLIIPR
jgi:tetratricopeptide (TPR) repeat protein